MNPNPLKVNQEPSGKANLFLLNHNPILANPNVQNYGNGQMPGKYFLPQTYSQQSDSQPNISQSPQLNVSPASKRNISAINESDRKVPSNLSCMDNIRPDVSKMNEAARFPNADKDAKWVWIDSDGEEEEYSLENCLEIEKNFVRRNEDAILNINDIQYVIKFGNPHTQRRLQNPKATRTVRRLNRNDVTWLWQDYDGTFKPYTAEASRQIEAVYGVERESIKAQKAANAQDYYDFFIHLDKASQRIELQRMGREDITTLIQGSNGKGYLVNFTKMLQLNERTLFIRKIRRGNNF